MSLDQGQCYMLENANLASWTSVDLVFGSFGNEPMQSCSVHRVSL